MTTPPRTHNAFSLVELLVVIGIIIILATITIGLGPRLVESRREAAAEQLLSTLDRAVEEFTVSARRSTTRGDEAHIAFWERIPESSAEVEALRRRFGDHPQARVNAQGGDRYLRRPDAAIFIRQARGVGAVDDIIAGLPERYVSILYGRAASSGPGGPDDLGGALGDPPSAISILDPWKNPILFVHPDNPVAQRLFGRCVGNRPYFVSAGSDGVYGLAADLPPAQLARATDSRGPGLRAVLEGALTDNITSYAPGAPDLTDAAFNDLRDDR